MSENSLETAPPHTHRTVPVTMCFQIYGVFRKLPNNWGNFIQIVSLTRSNSLDESFRYSLYRYRDYLNKLSGLFGQGVETIRTNQRLHRWVKLPTKSYSHACKKELSCLQKGREVLSKVWILSVFVKILTGFIKIQAVFDKITAGLLLFQKFWLSLHRNQAIFIT